MDHPGTTVPHALCDVHASKSELMSGSNSTKKKSQMRNIIC